ncbi:hypothetical protein CF392_06980 [Tamilnaduibacter salinus]|uniref:DUF3887 domain-containing protein n=1 Tax=Tamilnaduibacter salinus TaxID=1484056 RepID=A0A2A2I3P4_9GAMM|nr:hypothetical protein [Tamilnaduibacter salinus]PAV26212.1 hypothetical protein CF392_06980 [Tamilnaduibacter salinus]
MKDRNIYLGTFLLLALSQLSLLAGAESKTLPNGPDSIVESKLVALENGAYGAFLEGSSSEFKAAMTEKRFQSVVAQLGEALNNGYSLDRLGRMEKDGYEVFIYRLDYSGSDNDALVRLVMGEGAVAGFWIQ